MTRYVTNGALLDVLEEDTEALILIDDRLVRGSVVSAELLWRCTEPRTFEELVAHCLEVFGAPPTMTIEDLTRAAVRALLDARVLREEP